MAELLPVDHDAANGSLWLKSFLVLDAYIKGAQPFVGLVMQRLHAKVIAVVKQSVLPMTGTAAPAKQLMKTRILLRIGL
jgi:hypothetical protein